MAICPWPLQHLFSPSFMLMELNFHMGTWPYRIKTLFPSENKLCLGHAADDNVLGMPEP